MLVLGIGNILLQDDGIGIEEEKQKLIANKETLEEKIKPVEDEIESLERTTFNGFDAAYYERQDKIKDLEKSIKEDKEKELGIMNIFDFMEE